MKKWVYVPKMMVQMDIPDEISSLPEPYREIEIEKYVAGQIMSKVEITDFKEGEYAD